MPGSNLSQRDKPSHSHAEISDLLMRGQKMRIAVTEAYGFSGKYMARRLLDLRHEVITLTNSLRRTNPFGESVKAFPYKFAKPEDSTSWRR